jgi:hypothetical protein
MRPIRGGFVETVYQAIKLLVIGDNQLSIGWTIMYDGILVPIFQFILGGENLNNS